MASSRVEMTADSKEVLWVSTMDMTRADMSVASKAASMVWKMVESKD